MIKLNTWKKMGLMVVLINQTFAATPCISTEEPFYRKWRGCDLPGERGFVQGESRVATEDYPGKRDTYSRRGYLSYNARVRLKPGSYLIKFDNKGSVDKCRMDRTIHFIHEKFQLELYPQDSCRRDHLLGKTFRAPHKMDYDGDDNICTNNNECTTLHSSNDGAALLISIREENTIDLRCFAFWYTIFLNSVEILRVGDNGFSSHPMMRQLPFNSEINYGLMNHYFTDKLKINIAQMNYFLHGLDFALNGDMGSSNAKFDEVEKIYANQGGYPGHFDRHHRSFRDHLVARFTKVDDRSNGLDSRITQVNDAQSTRISMLETQVQTILDGLNRANERIQEKDSAIQELKNSMKELQEEVTKLTAENQRLITIVNEHERMVEKIQKSIRSSSPRSVSAGRQARH